MRKATPAFCGHGRQMRYLAALQNGGMPVSAFLFSGADGVGKKTIALRFIAGLLCGFSGNVGGFGCGSCETCAGVESGIHPDFIVWHGNEEIGIAEVHELKRRLTLHSYGGSYRGALIDNAHRLLPDAQSALLKILEEPTPKTLFFLVSSRPHLLFETVRSRLLEIVFGRVPDDELRKWQEAEFSGVNPGESALLLAEGRPGLFKRFLENPDLLKEERKKISKPSTLLSMPLADQFLFSEKLVGEGDGEIKDFLGLLISKTRARLFAEENERKELIGKLRSLLELYFQFETTNVNKRLLVDSALLEARNPS